MEGDDKKGKVRQSNPPNTDRGGKIETDDAQYDSDDTIEMTEEEIDLACRQFSGISS
jgi:DNA-repair protein XRCC1